MADAWQKKENPPNSSNLGFDSIRIFLFLISPGFYLSADFLEQAANLDGFATSYSAL
jgi:hypothetical protein